MDTDPIEVEAFGIDTPHDPDWICDRPNGSGSYLFMCFSTPFLALTPDGKQCGEPGDCLINEPSFPNWHGTVPGETEGFRNDWVHLTGRGVAERIARFHLPLNTIFPGGDGSLMTPFLDRIRREQQHNEPYGSASIRCQLELLLISMARARENVMRKGGLSRSEQFWKPRFQSFRSRLHAKLEQEWRVEQMATEINLSPNRFCALYRRFFNVSPVEDLIRVRIEHAKMRLVNSSASLGDVAAACGFTNLFYFSRLFKRRVGIPPGAYARKVGGL